VLAVVVASPCTAPFMGASLGLAIQMPAVAAMGLFVGLGVGMALPFVVLSAFPRLTHWLPKPGAWMLRLRQGLAFPMWATAVWLVWVLGQQVGMGAVAWVLSLHLATGLWLWVRGQALLASSMWLTWAARACLAGVVLVASQGAAWFDAAHQPPRGGDEGNFSLQSTAWQAWSPQRVSAALSQGQPVLVDFTAAWCITCQYNKRTTLASAEVDRLLTQKQVVRLRADWTQKDPEITQALAQLGRNGVPTYAYYEPHQPAKVLSEIISIKDLVGLVSAR
jgi:thiol:disulfide interchange protein